VARGQRRVNTRGIIDRQLRRDEWIGEWIFVGREKASIEKAAEPGDNQAVTESGTAAR